jgi:hypothetical protein
MLPALPVYGFPSHTWAMAEERWWSRLQPAARAWLIANNGDAVPEELADEVAAAGGPVAAEPGGEDATDPGLHFPDEVIDRIEEIANAEAPSDYGD